jgi:hypothetical protein
MRSLAGAVAFSRCIPLDDRAIRPDQINRKVGAESWLNVSQNSFLISDDQRVAAAREFQRVAQGWAIRHRARQLLGENPPASRFGKCVPLHGKILVNGRNPGVTDQHRFRCCMALNGWRRTCSRDLPRNGALSIAPRDRVSSLFPFGRVKLRQWAASSPSPTPPSTARFRRKRTAPALSASVVQRQTPGQ